MQKEKIPENSKLLVKELTKLLGKEKVKGDLATLIAYSTDAGIQKLMPKAVVSASQEEDVKKVLEYAEGNNISVTARSAGSSCTGGAIGEGIILDFLKLNKILELNKEEKWVRINPGVIHGELNKFLAKYNLMFGPDPASGDFSRLGGNLGCNASGPRSVKYGCTSDYCLELVLYLADGKRIVAKEMDIESSDFKKLLEDNPPLKKIFELVKEKKQLIKEKKLKVKKNASGYNIFSLAEGLEKGKFDFTKLFVGSEGTLGIITEAKLALVRLPKERVTMLCYFNRLDHTGMAATDVLALCPTAVEIMDSNSLDLIGRASYNIPQDAKTMLLIEFTEGDLKEKVSETEKLFLKYDLSAPIEAAFDNEKQEILWKVRKAILPTLSKYDKKKKPIPFAEDTVVPTEKVPDMIQFMDSISKKYNVPIGTFGHIGDGNIHFRPLIDVNDPDDLKKIPEIAEEINKKAIEFGGSITGEHGDGRVGGRFLKKLYGEEIVSLFERIKEILDPKGILNPGVKLSEKSFIKNIDYEKFKLPCSTCGKCNPVCPVFDALGGERYGPRGRYRIMNSKEYPFPGTDEILDLCLGCKSCTTICPSGVDVADDVFDKRSLRPNKFVGMFTYLQRQKWLFENLSKIGAATYFLWNSKPARLLMEKAGSIPLRLLFSPHAGISKNLILPKTSIKTLRQRHKELTQEKYKSYKNKVAYFHGCMANLLSESEGDAVIKILKRHNIDVCLPEQNCCGLAASAYGLKKYAKEYAIANLKNLIMYDKIITSCASCHHTLKQYPKLFADDIYHKNMAENIAGKTYDMLEFLAKFTEIKIPESSKIHPLKVTYHDPCHHRAVGISKEPRKLLKAIPGVEFIEMEDADRCCGGAGIYNIKNYEISSMIFNRKKRAIEASGAEVVASSCPGCIIQIKAGMRGKIKVVHPIQLLADLF